MYGPTCPGFQKVSTAPHTGSIVIGYRDLHLQNFPPMGHLDVDIYMSAIIGLPQTFAAIWVPPTGTLVTAKVLKNPAMVIQLYEIGPLLTPGRTVRGIRWPLGDRGGPFTLEVLNTTPAGPLPWAVMVVPKPSYYPVPAFPREPSN